MRDSDSPVDNPDLSHTHSIIPNLNSGLVPVDPGGLVLFFCHIYNLIFTRSQHYTCQIYKLSCRLTIFPQFSYQGQDHKSFNLSTIRWRQRRNFPIYQFSMKLQSAGSLLIAGRRQGVFSGTSFVFYCMQQMYLISKKHIIFSWLTSFC